jgi:uncharacterized OB-fold protein
MVERRPDRTLGPSHDQFWDWCDKDELRLQHCSGCGNIPWPVTLRCSRCGSEKFDWQRLSGVGKIVSWCSFEKDYYIGLMAAPYDTILVELEEGPLFISNPVEFGARECRLDMPVALSFIDAEDSAGRFRLPVFRAI